MARIDNLLNVQGELDLATGPRLGRTLRWLEYGSRPVRLDLQRVSFVDCAGWRFVVEASQRRQHHGLPALQVTGASPQVRRLAGQLARFDATHLGAAQPQVAPASPVVPA